MLLKNLLLSIMVALLLFIYNFANADDNGLIYPPADNARIFEYPPEIITSPQIDRLPVTPRLPVYNDRRMPQPRRVRPIYPRYPVAPAYGGYLPQGYSAQRIPPYPMPNRDYPSYPRRNNSSSFPFSNNRMPFGATGTNGFNPFSGGNMPFTSNSFNNPMNNMFGNNKNSNVPFFKQSKKKHKKAWGDERNIWPDFYTDYTDDAWDNMMGGPRDLGQMPGGWRFPYISTPDPVTVSDAITNQFPPIMEEGGNMMDFSDWGMFDKK